MSKAPYLRNLNPRERAACLRTGAILKLAQLQAPPERAADLIKRAISIGGALDTTAKTVVVGSLLTGIPVGIMAHLMSKKISDVRRKERELTQQINYYREAAQGLETGLAQAGVKA